ncbi:MAG: hypothetical protein U0821_26475 [Chloroflexota bacterium]
MQTQARLTVALPVDLVRDIDRLTSDRSRFLEEAAQRELERRRRAELLRSLESPHPETAAFAETGFRDWASSLPNEDAASLVDARTGTHVRWVDGQGWVEVNP